MLISQEAIEKNNPKNAKDKSLLLTNTLTTIEAKNTCPISLNIPDAIFNFSSDNSLIIFLIFKITCEAILKKDFSLLEHQSEHDNQSKFQLLEFLVFHPLKQLSLPGKLSDPEKLKLSEDDHT